jgi:hypothetical protein
MIAMTALHEAAHATIAKLVGIEVVSVSIDESNPHVRTRYRPGRTVAERIAALERLAVVDLAGTAIEPPPASAGDERNARRRIEQIIMLQYGLNDGDKLNTEQLAKAAELRRQLFAKAEHMVAANLRSIMDEAAQLSRQTK